MGPINASKTLSIDKDKGCGEIQPNGTDTDKAHLTNRKYWKNNEKHRKVWEGSLEYVLSDDDTQNFCPSPDEPDFSSSTNTTYKNELYCKGMNIRKDTGGT